MHLKVLFVSICSLLCIAQSALSQNVLNEWWKPIDIGSVALLDTSSYFDPYRTDTSRFRPYIHGYVGVSSSTESTTTRSFEECMEKCIEDINCKAFEINMLFLPFQCRLSVKACPNGECAEFTSHPEWKHFVRDNDNTHISVKSTVSLDTLDGKYKPREVAQMRGYSVEKETNNEIFDYVEIETLDADADSISVDYVWFEYKLTPSSNWLKCQRVPLPRVISKYRIQNKCIHYDFNAAVRTECDVLKESWEYHSITPRTTKIRNINFDDTEPSLTTCSNNLIIDSDTNSKIQYKKLDVVYAVRLFSTFGKFAVNKIELIKLQQIYAVAPTTITQFGDNDFKLQRTVNASNWYWNILKDGGYLWCRNPLHTLNKVAGSNVFQRNHHTCYYRGSTLSKKSNTAMSDDERIHYFNSAQCSFDTDNIPSCSKAWVEIHERCQGWEYCAVSLVKAIDIKIYHKPVMFPIVSWRSGWNRAHSKESEYHWSLDYITDIFLILHDCGAVLDDYCGCSQCFTPYYEAEYNPDIKYEDLRIYKYAQDEQHCRPQPGVYENECKEKFFCPKGWPSNDFSDHQYWTCRTRDNGMQKVSTGMQITEEAVNQGFGCIIN